LLSFINQECALIFSLNVHTLQHQTAKILEALTVKEKKKS